MKIQIWNQIPISLLLSTLTFPFSLFLERELTVAAAIIKEIFKFTEEGRVSLNKIKLQNRYNNSLIYCHYAATVCLPPAAAAALL